MTPDAFTALYQRHYNLVRSIAAYYGVGWDELDDVTQEVFVRLWRTNATMERDGVPWLSRVTRNLLIDRARRRQDTVDLDALRPVPCHADDLDTRLLAEALLDQLDDPLDRRIVEMTTQGWSVVEIGAVVGLSKASVSRRYNYALLLLRGGQRRERRHNGHPVSRGNVVRGLGKGQGRGASADDHARF